MINFSRLKTELEKEIDSKEKSFAFDELRHNSCVKHQNTFHNMSEGKKTQLRKIYSEIESDFRLVENIDYFFYVEELKKHFDSHSSR